MVAENAALQGRGNGTAVRHHHTVDEKERELRPIKTEAGDESLQNGIDEVDIEHPKARGIVIG